MSLGLGILIFGSGELIVLKSSGIIIFDRGDVLWRFLAAYAFASLSMTVVAALAFLFSSLVENAIGPIVATMAVIIVFIIISAINVSFFQMLRPYLFTTYMTSLRLLFDNPLNLKEITESVLILGGHAVLFFGLSAYIFNKKDILS
jgi:ABC-2 type transport system permease protein